MYGLFAHKEITALRTKHVYRLEIYKKDFSGTAMELEEFSGSPFSITLEGEGDEIYRPIIKSYLSINIIDKDQFDYTQFFTSDAFGFRVFLLRNGVRLWSGYITPDSFGQDLQYRSTINLVARDNIGYLSEIDYDWFDYDFVSIEQLLTKAFDKIQAQFSLDNRVNIFSGNKPITDAYIQTVGLKDKTWFEVLEEVLSGCGLQLRYINDNYTLHDIANEVELGGNYTPTFIDRSQRVDFSPAWREEQLEQDYLKIDNFFNKMPNKDKYEFIKLNNKDFSRPGERLYTIQGWNQSEANASNGILFNNPDELYYNTSFNQDTGTYIFDKIPNTSMLINSDNKTEYPNSSISTSFICKKSSTPLHINIDAFNELFEVEYYEGIGHVISRHYGFNYNTYHLNFYCNIFLEKEDGSTLICKNNTWEPYDSSNQDYRIELNLPETPDPLTAESFQEDKTQLDIVVKSIPENGDLIFTIYRWGTSYTGTLLGSFAMRIDNIKMYFKDEKEDISGQESKITINESNNVKQSFDFKYGQIPDSSGGYLAFAGGLHDNDDYHTPLTGWYRSAFPGNKYNLLELVGRGLAHHGKKARKIMTGTILFDGQDFSKILVIDNEKYVINGGTYDVTKETLTGEFIEVEPYSTDDYVITGGAVSGGSSNISTGGNRDTLLWTDNAANTKRVNELGVATSDDLAGSNLLIDNPEWSEAKRISADMLDDKFYWDKSLDTTEDKSDKDSWIIRTKHSIVSDKGISAYGLGSTSGGSASGSLGELVNVGQWADEVPTADRVMVQLAGATHWSAKPLADLVGLDTAALAQYLTANSYLKASDISNYLTWANLSGKPTVYPTSWELVTGRPTKLSDLTDDVVAGNYLPKPTWDAVFEVVTVDGTPALKVKYNILGLKGITAYADGSLSGGFSGALVDLVDVAVTNLASGDILKYNGTHFVNVPVSSIAGASSWDQITGKPEYYPTRWADVSGAPASLPASDVYPWAKAASKPTYTAAEVGAVALNGGGDVSGSINASAYLTANTLRAKAALYPTISFVKTNDNSESLLIVAGNNLYYRPVASDTTNRLVYHSGNFNPGNYLLLSGGTMTGDITFGSNGRSIRGSDGGNIAGVLYDTPNARYVTAIGTGSRRLILVSPASIYRGAGGVAENYMIYDSGNSNLSSVDWSANNLNAAANLDVAGQAYVSGWLRSRGNVGWYSQDYGGGIHMTDSTWVRVYGSKGLMIDTGTSPINMGQLQITCSAEASIGFRSASNGNWCLGKGVKSIGSGFGLYNAVTNRAAFQIDSATDNASFVGSITAPTFVGNLSGSASSVNGYDINSFTGYYKYTIDASSLDQNTYYPVTMYLGNHNTVRISVIVALDSGTKPAWSSHASGYSVRFIEEVNGSGWGTSEVSRNILANEYRFANANPVGRVEQMTNSSTEVIWVRGGGKYFFYLSIPYITPALRTSTFTNASQSVSPRTDTMDLRMAANGNGIAVSKLYAHNSIEINGFTIDVYNGALRVNGNLVATGGVTAYQ